MDLRERRLSLSAAAGSSGPSRVRVAVEPVVDAAELDEETTDADEELEVLDMNTPSLPVLE